MQNAGSKLSRLDDVQMAASRRGDKGQGLGIKNIFVLGRIR